MLDTSDDWKHAKLREDVRWVERLSPECARVLCSHFNSWPRWFGSIERTLFQLRPRNYAWTSRIEEALEDFLRAGCRVDWRTEGECIRRATGHAEAELTGLLIMPQVKGSRTHPHQLHLHLSNGHRSLYERGEF